MQLVHGRNRTSALGLALGLTLWIVLIALAMTEGLSRWIASPLAVGMHVRLLVVIPLLFLCESSVDPCVASFVRTLARSGVVPEGALPNLSSKIVRIVRWRDSWIPEAVCVLLAVILWWYGTKLTRFGTAADYMLDRPPVLSSLTGQWYWDVCLTVFRFLILRWFWRLLLWWYFLGSLCRLPLRLVPVHPDGAGGIGYLEIVHAHFAPLVVAISVTQTASFVEGVRAGTMPNDAIYPAIATVVLVDALLFLVPLAIFSPKLWACRMKGTEEYMRLAERYATLFDEKWAGTERVPDDKLLGAPDLNALVALKRVITEVGSVRWIPASPRLLSQLTIAAFLPMAPLLLLKYPLADLLQKFVERLSGL
ncbi:hypothetical protein [Pararobbsia alpina]|uniref:Uncharacterized protein n=1 Tax=Pararobbsia alpina TaxID=621374 RepID=A0A6S7BPM8_9BURK|nr:hypothetical protein [Pararobbsia alpina]CAB3807957.1 hypothetical protein LMG28138_05988 [Pararobbsia alpina]